jgi:hypothetical protein
MLPYDGTVYYVMPGPRRRASRRRAKLVARVPGIHVYACGASKAWMAGTSPAMTENWDTR